MLFKPYIRDGCLWLDWGPTDTRILTRDETQDVLLMLSKDTVMQPETIIDLMGGSRYLKDKAQKLLETAKGLRKVEKAQTVLLKHKGKIKGEVKSLEDNKVQKEVSSSN